MGKRFFAVAVLIVVLMGVFALPVFATEAVTEAATEEIDVLYRVKEFLAQYTSETFTVSGVVSTVVALVIAYLKSKKSQSASQGVIVDTMNKMIDENNAMRKENAQMRAELEETKCILKRFFEKATAVQLETSAILEIAERVYVNNKNLPQGVKDNITQIYAQCKIDEGGIAEEVSAIEARLIDTSEE